MPALFSIQIISKYKKGRLMLISILNPKISPPNSAICIAMLVVSGRGLRLAGERKFDVIIRLRANTTAHSLLFFNSSMPSLTGPGRNTEHHMITEVTFDVRP